MARLTAKSSLIDSLGNTAGADILAGYQVANKDEGATSYYGYVDTDGNWYIQRVTGSDVDFARGLTNYPTNWTNRAALSYDKFNIVF